MSRPRAADDYPTIRARMEELRREREGGGDDPRAAAAAKPGPGDGDIERRRRRADAYPAPWVPTIFSRRPRR